MPLPRYAHAGDAGCDLHATADAEIGPGERTVLGTGIAMALPDGYAGFVHPRSGLAARHGVTVVNSPGTIDAGYRGEIQVVLVNSDRHTPVTVRRLDRIAQLVVQRVEQVQWVETTDELPTSARGVDGYGSTGGFDAAGSSAGEG